MMLLFHKNDSFLYLVRRLFAEMSLLINIKLGEKYELPPPPLAFT